MDMDKWKKNRTCSLMIFCLVFFINGLALTIYQPTEFYYFRDTMKLENADLYYGLSQGVMYGSSLLFSFIASIYVQNISRVKQCFLCTDAISMIGNVLYVSYYHPVIVFVGQILIGTGAARTIIAINELAKLYKPEEVTGKVALLTLFSTIGGALGPCTTYLFNLVETHISWWKLDVNNMPGVVMGSLYGLCFVVNLFALNNLSRELKFDKEEAAGTELVSDDEFADISLKELEESKSPDGKEVEEKEEQNELSKQYVAVIKTLFENRMIAALYFITFFGFFTRTWLLLLTPIKSSLYLNWIQTNVASVFLVSILIGTIPTNLLIMLLWKRIKDVDVALYSFVTLLIALVFMMVFPYVPNSTAMAAFMYISNIFAISSAAAANIAGRSMLARMVPPDIKGMTESIYNRCYDASKMVAGLVIIIPSVDMRMALVPLIALCVVEFVWMLINRNEYRKVKRITLNR